MSKKERVSDGVIESDLCKMLSRLPGYAKGFPRHFMVVRADERTVPIVVDVVKNTATIISLEYTAAALRKHVAQLDGDSAHHNVTYAVCKRVVDSWMHQRADLTELPIPVGFKNEPALCLSRLDFDPVDVGKVGLAMSAPIFAGMLSRITNADALCMRIGSIFDPKADKKQAVWLSGETDGGKSQLVWLLEVLSGGGFMPLDSEILKTAWWKALIVGKRVVVTHEAIPDFLRSSAFKSITGDGNHTVNHKGRQCSTARIDALLFFFSNNPPEIPHDPALIGRIIDCRVAPVPEGDRLPEVILRDALRKELPFIAGYCLALYRGLGVGNRIASDGTDLAETIGSFEGDYLDFLEHNFVMTNCTDDYVLRSVVQAGVEARFGFDQRHQVRCKRILTKRFKITEKKRPFETNGMGAEKKEKRLYVYCGMRERTEGEKQFFSGKKDNDKATLRGNIP